MLWSLIDPVKYTFCLLGSVILITSVFAPKFGWKRGKTFFGGVLLSIILFVPLCIGINKAISPFRFGVFSYGNHQAISSSKIARWLPAQATAITVHQRLQGFEAKYSVASDELQAWIDGLWQKYGEQAAMSREKQQKVVVYPDDEIAAQLDWTVREDDQVYFSPHVKNWAGFTIWFNAAEGIAYQEAGYW